MVDQKILMVLNDIAWFWSHRQPLAKAILQRENKLHIATAGAIEDEGLMKMNVIGHDLPEHGQGFGLLFHFKILWALIQLIQKEKPTLIHGITLRHAFYTGLAARFTGHQRVVLTLAGVGSLFTDQSIKMNIIRSLALPFLRLAFKGKGRSIIFQNPDDLDLMIKHKVILKSQTTLIRGSGVNLDNFRYTVEQETDGPIVLFSSRLIREKGIDDFIEAASLIKRKGIKVRFQIAGDIYPKNPNSLTRDDIQRIHDEGIVEWLGQVADMPSLFKKVSIMCLPSYYGEGVPKILLEAAATGRACITCDVPGCREAVIHEKNGLLVPPKSSKELAAAIEKLLLEPDLRQKYGQQGRKMMEEDFHEQAVVSKTLKVYDNA